MKNFCLNPTVTFVTALFFLFSCSKVEKESQHHSERPSFLRLPASADVRLQPLVDSLWYYEHHRLILDAIISRFGFTGWEHGMIGYRGKTLVAIIPLSVPNASQISGFIAFEMDDRLRFKVFDASRPERYGGNNGLHRANTRTITNTVNALNFKMFGISLARIDDPCAMSRKEAEIITQARNGNPQRKIQLNVRTIEVTSCYSWVTCIGDGEGNCVSNITYHSDCITNVIWTPDGSGYEDWWTGNEEDLSGDGGSGGGYSSEPCGGEEEGMEAFYVPPPEKPILDINRYVDCFTPSKQAKITFYADQPISGTSFEFSVKEKAGHAFITIQQNVNGSTIIRSLGFYARSSVDPFFNKTAVSQLGDNSNENYDVKLTVDVTGIQLASILGIIRGFNPIYNLEEYNCTNFVLDISDAAGLHVDRTIGKWGVGSGLNPGNFGQDLKKIQGTITGEGKSPVNLGDCN